jgi:hypothetical protein
MSGLPPNGNGLYARLMADLVANNILGQNVFSWSTGYFVEDGKIKGKKFRSINSCQTKVNVN